jgi:hypothetical protein
MHDAGLEDMAGFNEGKTSAAKLIEQMLFWELNKKPQAQIAAEDAAKAMTFDEYVEKKGRLPHTQNDPPALQEQKLNDYMCARDGGTWKNGACELPQDATPNPWWAANGKTFLIKRMARPAVVTPTVAGNGGPVITPEVAAELDRPTGLRIMGVQIKTWHLAVGVAILALVGLLLLRGK